MIGNRKGSQEQRVTGEGGEMATTAAVACPWYTVVQMAVLFAVHPRTIWKWSDLGRLPKPVRKSRKWVCWPKDEVDALLREWGKERR